MPTKVNGVADSVQTAPTEVPEAPGAQPKEAPMTPVTPQGANVVDPNAAPQAQPAAPAPVNNPS